ncbi:uncharacterized protein LOC111694666 [Trichogramma pretiosum]|uniref:uncharacterized protein LOC111694666 n=1 Tax=Trichogramma pretiosum TaxID=7493 RepID=UPI000C71ABC6|nr:uncharacterized protein LOC111694666 [Trichogramma pretiosum]
MSRKGRCLSTSSWLVDPQGDQKSSAPPPDEEAVVETPPSLPPPPSTTHRDAPTPSYRSIAEIEKIMPYFDGKSMPVAQFIHDCKVAKRFLRPADHEFFIALLKARVKDGVSCYLQHKIFTSDDEIYDELKRAYAPSRGLLPDLLGNLSRARQGTDEKVVDYGFRISRLLRAASDNIRENLEPNLVPGALESAAISALASFTRGLRREVEEVVDRQNPKSLEAVIDVAFMAEAKIADPAAFDNDPPKNFQRVRAINPSSQNPRLCFNCNKEGHIARNCRAPRPGVICRSCNKEEHIARYCPEHLNEDPPVISVANRNIKAGRARFLIDTGSDLNLIKRASLLDSIPIDHRTIFHLSGINDESVATFGRVILRFFNRPCPLDIGRDNFPIEYDGILGMEFLRTQKAILSFADNCITIGGQSFRELPIVQHKTHLLRARTRTLVNVGCEFREGSSYVPHNKAGLGIFAGECIVKAHDHRAPLFIVNATSYDINLTLPPIKKHEFETSARIVPKKAGPNGEKKWRLVIDYRMLNEKTIASAYPLPNITEILDQLGSSKYFSTLDLQSGFYQVPIDPSDAHKTAFSTPYHHLQFKRMPMGLKRSPSTF